MSKEVKKLYADLVVLHDKFHSYHIRTVKMSGCATLHPTLGMYDDLDGLVDSFGENVIQKFYGEEIPTSWECYELTDIEEGNATCPCEIVNELLEDIEMLENFFQTFLNNQDNDLAQLVGPIREKFTNMCADLYREKEEDKDD